MLIAESPTGAGMRRPGFNTYKLYNGNIGNKLYNIFASYSKNYIRPLAKLSKAVKVADTGNQGKAESKSLSAVTVTLREDTESFKKTDGVFNKDTFS